MTPSTRTVLGTLPRPRLLELARSFAIELSADAIRDRQIDALEAFHVPFRDLLEALGREELKAACKHHGLDDTGRARSALAARLLQAHGATESTPPRPLFTPHEIPRYAPHQGDIAVVRHRQWLVAQVTPPPAEHHQTAVSLVCLDDDNQGDRLDVLWELELGARIHQPEAHGLGEITGVDPPRHFAAYLHALKWSAVTATDAKLFQSPFRAGIKLMNHQLTPLRKALALPRANIFIADDVGLGKTIEAGLIAQELLLRQRIEFVLIVCPSSVCLQWREEMEKRFGLGFEVMSRAFIGRRRQERGFGVNPWATHTRFIVSHQLLRRPEYRDGLLAHLGDRQRRSLLILDEAHVAAPASSQRYAVDSKITEVVRDIAHRFENRLFLSATPHNGHTNSFSALLEILDPQRFTRGVKVRGREQLEPIMVRRLKEDLRKLGVEQFPLRRLIQLELAHDGERWSMASAEEGQATSAPVSLGETVPAEMQLATLLAEYTRLTKPERGSGGLVFINLQKRLLSSVEAFHRTLEAHTRSLAQGRATAQLPLTDRDDDEYGPEDDDLDEADAARVASGSQSLPAPGDRARTVLTEMARLAAQYRGAPDAKVLALVDWIRRNQCPAVRIGGVLPKTAKSDRAWTDRRVILFTEYGDSKRYVQQLLQTAVDDTHDGDRRIMVFHGGMSDEQREEVQRAFNSPPDDHPVRILLATDAAREGVNLQGHCADLFHYDVPWNPSRLEQRNGRIDRTLQSSPEVRCHYFLYSARTEDQVLRTLIKKVDVIQRELGSIGSVLLDRLSGVLEGGITDTTVAQMDEAERAGDRRATAADELESQRGELKRLKADIDLSGAMLNASRTVMNFDPNLLRDALDVGLELSGAQPLTRAKVPDAEAWTLPTLPASWQNTLDALRPPRGRDEPFWEFRKKAPLPIVFRPPPRMNSALAHVHLQHPLVQRVLGRFLSQGYSAHDLHRVTVVRTRHDGLARVIAFGRLSLFGAGATRLHDQLISVAGKWIDGKEEDTHAFKEEADRKAIDMLEQVLAEAPTLEAASPALQARIQAVAPRLFAALWRDVRDEADSRAVEAEQQLARRATEESDALTEILRQQQSAIVAEIERRAQLSFDDLHLDRREEEQYKRERAWFDERLVANRVELETEPPQIRELYRVALRRLEPVGLVVLWPETRG